MDKKGFHLAACKWGGWCTHRHDAPTEICNWMKAAGYEAVLERRSKGDGFLMAMLPCSELGTSGRKALLQSAEYSELGSLEQVSFISLLIHVVVQCFNPKARLFRIASLRSLQRARKWAHSSRIWGRKCLYILVKSLHGMAAAAVHLKSYHRRDCDLRFFFQFSVYHAKS